MIIGITGTNGAGKGTIVQYLTDRKGFVHFSVRQFLTEQLLEQGREADRPAMRELANSLRKEHGPSYVVEQLLDVAEKQSEPAVVESVRAVGEAELLKKKGAILWAVDAERKIRYDRSFKRWSATDNVTFEQFCEYEDREMNGTEPWDMNVFGVMKLADHTFTNNGTPEEFFVQVEAELKKLEK